MPAAWSPKDERQYGHILASCRKRGRYGQRRCKQIAGATVNKQRRREGRTLSGDMPGYEQLLGRPFWKKGACWQKYKDGDTGRITTRQISRAVCELLGLTGRRRRGGRTLSGLGAATPPGWLCNVCVPMPTSPPHQERRPGRPRAGTVVDCEYLIAALRKHRSWTAAARAVGIQSQSVMGAFLQTPSMTKRGLSPRCAQYSEEAARITGYKSRSSR